MKKQATNEKRVHFQDQLIDFGDEPATPVAIKAARSKVAARKSVFLENYTDSPEFTHVDNPIVYMEKEVLPEERGFPLLKSVAHLAREPRRGAPKGVKKLDPPRRAHPLSQVKNASPDVSQRSGAAAAETITISDDDEEDVEIYDEEDEEEPEDDTFDFLRSR